MREHDDPAKAPVPHESSRRDPVALGGALRELLTLAVPLSVGYVGGTLLGFVDTAVVGRLGAAALGAVGIGNAVFFAASLVAMGVVSGADPLIAQAVGAGEPQQARAIYWQAIRVGLYACGPIFLILLGVGFSLELFGIDGSTAHATRAFLLGRALNAPTFLVFAAARSYLQSAASARAIVVSMIVANVVNFLLDGILVFGDRALLAVHLPPVGMPALGVFGAGLASTLASIVSMAIVVRAAARVPVPDAKAARAHDEVLVAKILRIGRPIGLQLLAEVGAFTIATFCCGRMGQLTVAGHHIALSIASATFTVALGIGSATTVLVGRAVGRGDAPAARRSGILGVASTSMFMACAALVFFFAPVACARVLTDQADVVAAAAPLLMIAAFFQLSDGAQATLAAALRGYGDTAFAQNANIIGHYLFGVPIAIFLGFYTPMGARGVWWGLSAGLTVVAVLLGVRFQRLSKRPIARA